mmetsp:Transcript_41288/g.109326  ORF Transcript_41288/g.109326 Transcript_41288/m.109326 type:complete len:231 (-) Transcript_41288:1564-2256(-)
MIPQGTHDGTRDGLRPHGCPHAHFHDEVLQLIHTSVILRGLCALDPLLEVTAHEGNVDLVGAELVLGREEQPLVRELRDDEAQIRVHSIRGLQYTRGDDDRLVESWNALREAGDASDCTIHQGVMTRFDLLIFTVAHQASEGRHEETKVSLHGSVIGIHVQIRPRISVLVSAPPPFDREEDVLLCQVVASLQWGIEVLHHELFPVISVTITLLGHTRRQTLHHPRHGIQA